jgi:UDP-glucose 4-epimerase
MKYLVTGTGGFIGYHLAKRLAKNIENTVYTFDRKEADFTEKNIIQTIDDLKNPFHTLPEVDVVYHLAAYNGTKHFYDKAFDVIKDNIIPTLNLLDFYKGLPLKRFVYSGTPESTAVFTEQFDYKIPTDEKCPIGVADVKNRRWSYANSKALGEQAVIASDLPYTIIRYNNVYGPRQVDHFISEFYDRINEGEFSLYGYKNTRTFIYIDDAIDATEMLLDTNKSKNGIYNIGGEEETTIQSVAETILKLMKIETEMDLYDAPEGSCMRRCPDITKLKKTTGFKQKISLEEGLKRTLNL